MVHDTQVVVIGCSSLYNGQHSIYMNVHLVSLDHGTNTNITVKWHYNDDEI